MSRSVKQVEQQLLFSEGALRWSTQQLTEARARIEELEEVIRHHLDQMEIVQRLLDNKGKKNEDVISESKGKKAPAEGRGADS